MPIPVINTTTSVLGYRQWEQWTYQPYATNSPTSWACPNLPSGLTLNTATGAISGSAEAAGIFVVGLTATNGDGTSAPLQLTIGIEAAKAALASSGYELTVNVVTREVSMEKDSKLFARADEDMLLWLRFVKDDEDSVLDLDLDKLSIALKDSDLDARLIVGDEWQKFGSGTGTYYGLYARFAGARLVDALQNYAADEGTAFDGKADIQWTENADHAFTPETITFSTRDFPVVIASSKGRPA